MLLPAEVVGTGVAVFGTKVIKRVVVSAHGYSLT